MPGDLGDLGKGSIGKSTLTNFLNLILSESELTKVMDDEPLKASAKANPWKMPSTRQQRHLDLCARLLSCAQRIYIVEEGWNSVNNPADQLLRSIQFDDSPSAQLIESPQIDCFQPTITKRASSPFVKLILNPLWKVVVKSSSPLTETESIGSSPELQASSDIRSIDSSYSILLFLSQLSEEKFNFRDVCALSPLLQLLTACTISFPFGQCWATSADANWYQAKPKDELRAESLNFQTCSEEDLAVVIYVVGEVLAFAGRSEGDDNTRICAIRCLSELANTSACIAHVANTSLRSLSSVWQRIWHIICKPSLAYVTFTDQASFLSRGESLCILLENIIRFQCTDLDCVKSSHRCIFLVKEIHSIWQFLSFNESLKIISPVVFRLIQSVVSIPGAYRNTGHGSEQNFGESSMSQNKANRACISYEVKTSHLFQVLRVFLKKLQDAFESEIIDVSEDTFWSFVQCCTTIISGKCPQAIRHNGHNSIHKARNEEYNFDTLDQIQIIIEHANSVINLWHLKVQNSIKIPLSHQHCKEMQIFSLEFLWTSFFGKPFLTSSTFDEKDSLNVQSSSHSILIGQAHALRLCIFVVGCQKFDSDVIHTIRSQCLLILESLMKSVQDSEKNVEILLRSVDSLLTDMLLFFDLNVVNQSLNDLRDRCRDLLNAYCDSKSFIDNKVNYTEMKVQTDCLWDSEDDDDDEGDEKHQSVKKRRKLLQEQPTIMKENPSPKISSKHYSFRAGISLASVLIAIDPKPKTLDFVFDALAISKENHGSIEVHGAVVSSQLICKTLETQDLDENASRKMFDVLLTKIALIRHGTHGGDWHFAFGYSIISKDLIQKMAPELGLDDLSVLQTFLLLPDVKEQRWITMRPNLLIQRLVISTFIFESCNETFRNAFANTFIRDLLMDALQSESLKVRNLAGYAVGSAFRHLSGHQMIFNNLTSIFEPGKISDIGDPRLIVLIERQRKRDGSSCWNHSVISFTFSLLRLWGVMAGCTSDQEIYKCLLFDCVLYAASSSPAELICHSTLDRMKFLRGYTSIQQMLWDEKNYLWERFVDGGIQPEDIPLNFASDILVYKLKTMGLRSFKSWSILETKEESIEKLIFQACTEFIFSFTSTILPICLSKLSLKELECISNENRVTMQNPLIEYINKLCTYSQEADSQMMTIRSLVEIHSPSILAHSISSLGANIENEHFLQFALQFISRQNLHQGTVMLGSSVRKLIMKQCCNREKCDMIFILNAIDNNTPDNWPSVAKIICDGAIEYLMECRYWLERAQIPDYKLSCWNMTSTVAKVILRNETSPVISQEVALRIMFGILQSNSLACCHHSIIQLMDEHFEHFIQRVVSSKKYDIILLFQLLATLLHVHVCYQIRLLETLMCHWKLGKRDEKALKSRSQVEGWIGSICPDFSDWLLANSNSIIHSIPEDIFSLLKATYDLINKSVDVYTNRYSAAPDAIHVDLASFVSGDDKFLILAEIDTVCFAQELFKKSHYRSTSEQNAEDSLSQVISSVFFFKENLFKRGVNGVQRHFDEGFDLDSRLLLYQIISLRSAILKDLKGVKATDEIYRISRVLLEVASGEDIDAELRTEASKCIGCLAQLISHDLLNMDSDPISPPDSLNTVATDSSSLSFFCISQVLEFITEQVKIETPLIVLACVEACKEIASTTEGNNAIKFMQKESSRLLIESFRPDELVKWPNLLTPSDLFVESTIKLTSLNEEEIRRSNDWCWNSELWKPLKLSYDEWIKRIVSSMIICCYRKKLVHDNARVIGQSLSLRALARISALSSAISTFLFPRIILDLLLSDDTPQDLDRVKVDTDEQSWIGDPRSATNKQISKSFTSLIEILTENHDTEFSNKASLVISSTLDLLRRINLKRFLGYNDIPPPLSAIPVERTGKVPRRFGMVLDIETKLVMKVLVLSRKTSSAIYHGESSICESQCRGVLLEGKSVQDTQYSLLPMLQDCLMTLQESSSASAYSFLMNSLRFSNGKFYLEGAREPAFICDANEALQHKNLDSQDYLVLSVSNRLYSLGSIDALRAYIDSISGHQQLSEFALSSLRETWFKAKFSMGDWDDVSNVNLTFIEGATSGLFESLTSAFTNVVNHDIAAFKESLEICRSQALSQLCLVYSPEFPLDNFLHIVHYFEILNDVWTLGCDPSNLNLLLQRWDEESLIIPQYQDRKVNCKDNDFKLMFREAIINIIRRFNQDDKDVCRKLTNLQWRHLSIYRIQGNLTFAETCLKRLGKRLIENETDQSLVYLRLRLEEARLMEARGDTKQAIQTSTLVAQSLEKGFPQSANHKFQALKADSLLACATWLREHRMESAKLVQEQYLIPAVRICHDLWMQREYSENKSRLCSACLALADSAGTLFEVVFSRVTSNEWKAKTLFLSEQRKVVHELEMTLRRSKEGSPQVINNLRQTKKMVNRLQDEIEKLEEELGPYATLAIQSYGEALSMFDKSSNEHWTSHVFRMISIWFSAHMLVPDVNIAIADLFDKIPSYLFLPLTNQLLSRLCPPTLSNLDLFQNILYKLISVLCKHHPYHCLPQLLSLIHRSDDSLSENPHDARTDVARHILSLLRHGANANELNLYSTYEALADAYHQLAMAPPTEKHKKQRRGIPLKDFMKRNDFRKILRTSSCVPCVLTRPPTIVENHDYGGFKIDPPGTELLKEIHPECCLTQSGLTRPKIIICVGSKGTLFKQLVKGNDDIRQDAIMQQVFTYANALLRRKTGGNSKDFASQGICLVSNKRLQLVTYNVVPLGPKSGIIEWVDDTQPFLDYLQDKNSKKRGAHSRYWKGEWSFQLCMEEMIRISGARHDEKLATFGRICDNFSPVFRFFFVELFGHDLQAWHTAKMTYTRSCAVASIVGHFLGIGDRHPNNILVHQKTGELVHIDFGIVFEQGRLLPTPETVPFRLTRDIVDGMGPLGTDGTFTNTAEATVRILRKHTNAFLIILSAVVSDPQYTWKSAAAKVRARQVEEDNNANEGKNGLRGIELSSLDEQSNINFATNHVISRIKEKLEGYEEDTSSEQQSVEGQVKLLISIARDHDNLCEIWRGWAPWL
jgi:serine-protein kinase ATM